MGEDNKERKVLIVFKCLNMKFLNDFVDSIISLIKMLNQTSLEADFQTSPTKSLHFHLWLPLGITTT